MKGRDFLFIWLRNRYPWWWRRLSTVIDGTITAESVNPHFIVETIHCHAFSVSDKLSALAITVFISTAFWMFVGIGRSSHWPKHFTILQIIKWLHVIRVLIRYSFEKKAVFRKKCHLDIFSDFTWMVVSICERRQHRSSKKRIQKQRKRHMKHCICKPFVSFMASIDEQRVWCGLQLKRTPHLTAQISFFFIWRKCRGTIC